MYWNSSPLEEGLGPASMWQCDKIPWLPKGGRAYHRWGAERGWGMGKLGRAGRGEGGGTGIGMCKIIIIILTIIIKILLWDMLLKPQTVQAPSSPFTTSFPTGMVHRATLKAPAAAFVTQSNKVQIPPNKTVIRPVTATSQSLVPTPVLGSPLPWRHTVTTATLTKENFSLGWLAVQRFSPLSSRCGGEQGGVQADMVLVISWLGGNRKWTEQRWGNLEHKRPQIPPHNASLPPSRAQPLRVPRPLGAVFFQTTTDRYWWKFRKQKQETSSATILSFLFHFRVCFFLTYEKGFIRLVHVMLAMSICCTNTAQVITLCGKPMSHGPQRDSVYSDPGVRWF